MRESTNWKYWTALSMLALLSAALAAGWWRGHRTHTQKLDAQSNQLRTLSEEIRTHTQELKELETRIELLLTRDSAESRQEQNQELMLLIDEIYGLLFKSGMHVQLAVETAPDGRLRLRADSAKIRDDLKSSLEKMNQLQLPVAPGI